MTMNQQICPKCQGEMEQGFVIDDTYGARIVSHWSSGQPKKSFWTGAILPGDKQIPIGTFRCKDCGYLESFARPGLRPVDPRKDRRRMVLSCNEDEIG